MPHESFDQFSSSDKDKFRSAVSSLLTHTYVLKNDYDFDNPQHLKLNRTYAFMHQNYELIREYLSYAGYDFDIDETRGVAYLVSYPESAGEHLDKLTTQVLYVLREIYAREKNSLMIGTDITISVKDLGSRLFDMGVRKDGSKPMAVSNIADSLRKLFKFNIVEKRPGDSWTDPETVFILHSSIELALDAEELLELDRLSSGKKEEEAD